MCLDNNVKTTGEKIKRTTNIRNKRLLKSLDNMNMKQCEM